MSSDGTGAVSVGGVSVSVGAESVSALGTSGALSIGGNKSHLVGHDYLRTPFVVKMSSHNLPIAQLYLK